MHPEENPSDGEYAVVRDQTQCDRQRYFTKLHDRREDAINEAKLLAQKEGNKFLVLKVIGYAEQQPQPAQWVDL